MWERLRQNSVLLLPAVTGAVYLFLKYLSPVVGPVLAAMIFVTILGPFLKKLQDRLHMHRQFGAVGLLLLIGAALAAVLWGMGNWLYTGLPGWLDELGEWRERLTTLLQNVMPQVLTQSWAYAGSVGELGGFLITFLIAVVLLAKDYDRFMNLLLDREDCHVVLEVICGVIRYLANFLRAQLAIMAVISGVSAATLYLSGVRNGIFWGLLAGVLDALPFIGTGIVLLPLAVFRFAAGDYVRAAVCVLLYAACAILREMLEPRLIGKNVGMAPLAVLVSLYAGIKLFGVIGIIKGPLGYVMIRQIYRSLAAAQPQEKEKARKHWLNSDK